HRLPSWLCDFPHDAALSSKNAVLREYFAGTATLGKLCAHVVFAHDLSQCPWQRFFGEFRGDNDDPIHVAKDQIARPHLTSADADWLAVVHGFEPALGIERTKSGREDGKIHLQDSGGIARQAVGHDADRAASPSCGRKQFSPQRAVSVALRR